MLEENHVHTNLVLTEENVGMSDRFGNPITTRIFTATQMIDLTFPEEQLRAEKRQIERALVWVNDIITRMTAL